MSFYYFKPKKFAYKMVYSIKSGNQFSRKYIILFIHFISINFNAAYALKNLRIISKSVQSLGI